MAQDLKTALVTGASSGIGEATARRLARSGYRVFGTSRRNAPPRREDVEMMPLDVTDEASVSACVAEVLRKAGGLDLLVNNAGFALIGALEESTTEQAKAIFDTNLFGVMRVTRAALPAMRARGRGRIVNISSVLGFLPAPFSGLYGCTKHALECYAESLDHEVRGFGIRVCLVEPGFTASRIAQNMPEPDVKLAAYDRGRTNVLGVFSEALAKAPDADTVARVVLEAANATSPKRRYPVGREAATLRMVRRLAPTAMFERGFRKQFRLDAA